VCRNPTEVRLSHADILGKSVLSKEISKHKANAQPVSGTKQACSRTSKGGRVAEASHLTKQEYCMVHMRPHVGRWIT